MKKKITVLFLLATMIINMFAVSAFAKESTSSNMSIVLSGCEGDIISKRELPTDVIPIKFKDIDQANAYLQLAQQMEQQGKMLNISSEIFEKYYDPTNNVVDFSNYVITENDYSVPTILDGSKPEIMPRESTAVKTKSISVNVLHTMTIYAKYTYANSKFKSVKSVTTNFSGLTIGNKWVQDTYSSSITSSGKKLNVHVYGHYDHYILIDTSLTHVQTTKADYKAYWNY